VGFAGRTSQAAFGILSPLGPASEYPVAEGDRRTARPAIGEIEEERRIARETSRAAPTPHGPGARRGTRFRASASTRLSGCSKTAFARKTGERKRWRTSRASRRAQAAASVISG